MRSALIVGSGFIARQHAQAIQAEPDVRLAAFVNPNPKNAEKLAEEFGCAYYPGLKEAMAGTRADIVDVCAPTHLHEQYVVEAAGLGCHVLCEKPVTFTLESFDRMVAACRDNGVTFMVAQVARWWPEFVTIRDYLETGKLGEPRMIYEKRLCQLPPWSTWHRDPKKSGGGLYDLNIHDVDFLASVLGRPVQVFAVGHRTPEGCWMHVAASLTWASGMKAVVETCLDMPGPWPFSIEFRATGSKGTLHYNLQAGVNIADGQSTSNFTWYPVGEAQPQQLAAPAMDMFREEIREFLGAIREGREPSVTVAQNRLVLEIVLATLQSLETGRAVAL